MNFDEKYEALLKEYEAKYTLPNWFVSGFKTLLSKNITLEDWNKMYVNLERLASDSAVLMKILKLYKSELVANSTLDNYYTKDKVYPKEKVYTKDEVYNKKETYAKTETYAKNEVYPKNEVYTKPETFSREEAMSLGLIQIKEYDSETGTVEIVYDTDVLSVAYNEETGELLFYYKTSTLDTDDEIPDIPSGGGTVEVDLSKYQTKKISAFVSGPLAGFDTVEDSLNEINKSLEALDNVDTSILDGSVSVGSAKSDELGNSIHETYATLKALNETKSEISKLISNAPESFDTLKEIADYIEKNESNASSILEKVSKNTEAISKLQNSSEGKETILIYLDSDGTLTTDFDLMLLNITTAKNYVVKLAVKSSSSDTTYDEFKFLPHVGNYDSKVSAGAMTFYYSNLEFESNEHLIRVRYNSAMNDARTLKYTNKNYESRIKTLEDSQIDATSISEKITPVELEEGVKTVNEDGLYEIELKNQAGEFYSIMMYVKIDGYSRSSAVKLYYSGDYYDVWIVNNFGALSLSSTDNDTLTDLVFINSITRILAGKGE